MHNIARKIVNNLVTKSSRPRQAVEMRPQFSG